MNIISSYLISYKLTSCLHTKFAYFDSDGSSAADFKHSNEVGV